MQVQEGPGWRLAVEPDRSPYPVLIGGEGWAVELRAEEARALWDGCCRLVDELAVMAERLMPQEQLTLELESGPLWLELEGHPQAWRLRFVLAPGLSERGVEGGWSEAAAGAMVAALRQARELSCLPRP